MFEGLSVQFGNRTNEMDNGRHINFGSDGSNGRFGGNKYNNDRDEPLSGKNIFNKDKDS